MADKPMSDLAFRGMSLFFRIRDIFSPPRRMVEEAGVAPGQCVLDFGCGPGSYSLAAAELVGGTGRVHALDIHPLAVRRVERAASRKGPANVETILGDCATGLESGSVDVVLLYDVFHALSNPDDVLRELHRVLRPEGILSFSDHHMKGKGIVSRMTKGGLFGLTRRGKRTYTFSRRG